MRSARCVPSATNAALYCANLAFVPTELGRSDNYVRAEASDRLALEAECLKAILARLRGPSLTYPIAPTATCCHPAAPAPVVQHVCQPVAATHVCSQHVCQPAVTHVCQPAAAPHVCQSAAAPHVCQPAAASHVCQPQHVCQSVAPVPEAIVHREEKVRLLVPKEGVIKSVRWVEVEGRKLSVDQAVQEGYKVVSTAGEQLAESSPAPQEDVDVAAEAA